MFIRWYAGSSDSESVAGESAMLALEMGIAEFSQERSAALSAVGMSLSCVALLAFCCHFTDFVVVSCLLFTVLFFALCFCLNHQ